MSNFFVEYYGIHHQFGKLKEEVCELISAIVIIESSLKKLAEQYPEKTDDELFELLIGTEEYEHLFEEMGDVENIIEQFEQWEHMGKLYCKKMEKKTRQMKRIKTEQYIGKMWGILMFLRKKEQDEQ